MYKISNIYISCMYNKSMTNEGERFMENVKKEKLGAGILTICIIHIVCFILFIFGVLSTLAFKDKIPELQQMEAAGMTLSNLQMSISIVTSIIMFISIILILRRKALGVYGYFTIQMINIIYPIILNGFYISILISSLIFPILMGICIYRKRHIFGFGCSNLNMDKDM